MRGFALDAGLVRGELGVDAQVHLLRVVLRRERIASASACASLRRFSISSRAAVEQPVALVGRVAEQHARLVFGDPEDLFELVPARRPLGCVGELFAQSAQPVLGIRRLRLRGRELGFEPVDSLASLVLRVGDLGLHPRLGLAALHSGAVFAVRELRDLERLRAHARGEARDRGVDLVLVVAAERRGERDVRSTSGRRRRSAGRTGSGHRPVVAVRGVVLRHRGLSLRVVAGARRAHRLRRGSSARRRTRSAGVGIAAAGRRHQGALRAGSALRVHEGYLADLCAQNALARAEFRGHGGTPPRYESTSFVLKRAIAAAPKTRM